MQSKKSFFNKTIFIKNLLHFSPAWIVYLLILIISNPANLATFLLSITPKNGYLTAEQILQGKTESMVALISNELDPSTFFLAGPCMALCVFSYLYKQRSSDAMHALPVTRKELFLTNYISGLVMMFFPEFITFLSLLIVTKANGFTYMYLTGYWLLAAVCESFFFYTLMVLVMMVTGVFFMAPIFYIVLNFLVAGMDSVIQTLLQDLCYGLGNGNVYAATTSENAGILTPFSYLQSNVTINYSYIESKLVSVTAVGGKALGIYVLVAVIFSVCAYAIYKKRALENVGKLITVSWLSPVFQIGVSVCAGCVGASICAERLYRQVSCGVQFGICLLTLLIVCAVAFFIAEMCLKKRIHVFTKKKFAVAGCLLAVMTVLSFLVEYDAFGLEKKMPKKEDVVCAELYTSYQIAGMDTEEIEQIMDFHKQLIAEKEENEAYYAKTDEDAQTYSVTFTYYLKDGNILSRTYDVPSSEAYLSDPNSSASKMIAASREEKYILRDHVAINYEDAIYQAASIDVYDDSLDSNIVTLESDATQKIMEAYLEDVKEGNFDSMLWYNNYDDQYMSAVSITYMIPDGVKPLYEYFSQIMGDGKSDTYGEYISSSYAYTSFNSGSFCITFTSDCTHILGVLKELGLFESEYHIMTCEKYNEISNAIYNQTKDTVYDASGDYLLDDDMMVN